MCMSVGAPCMRTCVCVCVYVCAYLYTDTHIHMFLPAHLNNDIYTAHTYMYTYMHTYTYSFTHVRSRWSFTLEPCRGASGHVWRPRRSYNSEATMVQRAITQTLLRSLTEATATKNSQSYFCTLWAIYLIYLRKI
jgi:hypothetical protein